MKHNLNYHKPQVIAEIGCNHKGDLNIAKELICLAKEAGAQYVKFQKRNPKELLTKEQYQMPHPKPKNSYGNTYGEHREYLEFDLKQHQELKRYCDLLGITYSTSVWDITSAKEMINLNPNFLKVPSACNNNFEMLKILRDEFQGRIHLSIGMTDKNEIIEIIKFFEKTNQAKHRLIIYACTSGYPVPPKDICLLEISWLIDKYKSRIYEIGFSGHHTGTSLDIAAYTLGAKWIERHFTKDKTWKGTDHKASLEPQELKQLIITLNQTYEALTYKQDDILHIEKAQRDKLKYKFH